MLIDISCVLYRLENSIPFSQEPCCPNVLIQKNLVFQVSYSVPFGIRVLSTIYTQALKVIVLAQIYLYFLFFRSLQQTATYKPLRYTDFCTLPLQSKHFSHLSISLSFSHSRSSYCIKYYATNKFFPIYRRFNLLKPTG
jgi:purine-cytosine permease-like protein